MPLPRIFRSPKLTKTILPLAAGLALIGVLAACGAAGLAVNEHAARLVKKAVVGTGGADKTQVQAMVKVLLPGVRIAGADAADALAVALADAHLS